MNIIANGFEIRPFALGLKYIIYGCAPFLIIITFKIVGQITKLDDRYNGEVGSKTCCSIGVEASRMVEGCKIDVDEANENQIF